MKSSPAKSSAARSSQEEWSIGELAARFGLATHVLRHWEDVGLLEPPRDGAGRRRYRRDELVRVAVIVRSKAAGMSLDQIQVLLDAEARDRHEVLEAHVADLDRRMAEMQLSREMTLHALECRAHDVATCPRFRRNVEDLIAGTAVFALVPPPPYRRRRGEHDAAHSADDRGAAPPHEARQG